MSLEKLFRPGSVAVVGASSSEASIGAELIKNLLRGPFQGPVFPVNPHRKWVLGIKAYATVCEIPDPVDLAVISVPKERVLAVIDDCGKKGVGAAVIITAGFKEVGGDGVALENALRDKLRQYGIRAIGPNCMGMIVTNPEVRLNASFAATPALPGNVAFLSQSGALGEAILALAKSLGLGLSAFVSLGNRVDVSVNDLLQHWAEDDSTSVVLMYIESFGNMQRFPLIAANAARKKPILAVKSGRTAEGARAASSHTGALASRDLAADALFEKTGILRAATMEELFTLATAFASQPLPKANRVAIVTNAGGPGILATDVLASGDMKLAGLTPETIQTMRAVLPAEASVNNPVDMIATSGPAQYEVCVSAALKDPGVDALIVIFVSPITIDSYAVAQAVVRGKELAATPEKPVLVSFMGKVAYEEGARYLKDHKLPVYVFPEEPAHALIAMDKLRRFRERPIGDVVRFEVDKTRASAAIDSALARGPGSQLSPMELAELLSAYGIATLPLEVVDSPENAVQAAERLGFPVVMKISAPTLVHKSDIGGVLLDLKSPMEVKGAYYELSERARALSSPHHLIVQPYARGGQEVILGFSSERTAGKLLVLGLGGVYVEVLKDIAVRLCPITDAEAHRMIESLKSAPLLRGYRGGAPGDIDALVEMIQRLSYLAESEPRIETLEMNPVLIRPAGHGVAVLDVRGKLRE
ncbi:MAG: acetate--CoA ligase family protein [Polyangiaceae bacterium]|nr:acetate--CoA ligase family protein [Polyangiaceae bacterium]